MVNDDDDDGDASRVQLQRARQSNTGSGGGGGGSTGSSSSIGGAASNLVNGIVGAGIIGIPYAIGQAGLVAGLVLLIVVAVGTDKSLRLLVDLAATFRGRRRGSGAVVATYEDLMRIPFGTAGANFILASMLVLAYGAMVSYLIIVKDTVPTVLGLGDAFWEREVVMTVTTAAIILPLASMRDVSNLAGTSLLSVAADAVLVVVVVLYAPVASSVANHGGAVRVVADHWLNPRLFIGLGVLSTAMACQHAAFLISGSLRNHTPRRWAVVTGVSLTIATVMSTLLGLFGYLGYLDLTQGNVLNNFPRGSVAVNGGRALLAVTMYLTFPMESFVARHVIVQLVYSGNMEHTTVGPDGQVVPEAKWLGCVGRRERITLLIYILALVPALIFDDLGPVLSLTGSLGASCISYIAPGLVYLGVNGGDFLDWAASSIRGGGSYKSTAAGEIELPVVGDAAATMVVAPPPVPPDRATVLLQGRKPWWWWLAAMPLWVAIASCGERGTRRFLADGVNQDPDGIDDDIDDDNSDDNNDVGAERVGPSRRDYIVSIAFIVFGVVAAVCGVVSNVYVEVHKIFYNPR